MSNLANDIKVGFNYDPFGMITFGRSWEVGSEYRYGFNTQEQDDEVYGNGNLNTAEFWTYDTRLGRRFNIDLVIKCNESSYATFANNPLIFIDFDGRDTARVDKSQNIEITEGGADALFIERKIKTFSSSELTSGRGIFDILSYMYVELGATTATLKDYSFSSNSDGSISIWKWTQIADLPGFRDYIGTVAGESSPNQNEAQGIGTIILKKLEKMGYSTLNVSYESLNDLHNNVSKMYARDKTNENSGYPAITKKTFIEIFETQAFNLQLLGAIKALQVYGQEDITNGAYFWEGENTIFQTGNSFGKKDGNGVNIFKIVGKSGETYFMIYNPKSAPYATNTWR